DAGVSTHVLQEVAAGLVWVGQQTQALLRDLRTPTVDGCQPLDAQVEHIGRQAGPGLIQRRKAGWKTSATTCRPRILAM
ncbi:MAG: hypothetical protein AAF412_15280, partial [Pseudomonadota bacterium]